MSLHDLETAIFEQVMAKPDNEGYPFTFRLGDGRSIATLKIDAVPYREGLAFMPVSLGFVTLSSWADLRDRGVYLRAGLDPSRVRLNPPPGNLLVGQSDLARAMGIKSSELMEYRRLGLFPGPDCRVGKRNKWYWTPDLALKVSNLMDEMERD